MQGRRCMGVHAGKPNEERYWESGTWNMKVDHREAYYANMNCIKLAQSMVQWHSEGISHSRAT